MDKVIVGVAPWASLSDSDGLPRPPGGYLSEFLPANNGKQK